MGACGKDHRTGNAEMRKQHFPEVVVNLFFGFGVFHVNGDITKRKPGAVAAEALAAAKRRKGRAQRRDGVPRRFGKRIAVAGGAGLGIRKPAGRDNHTIRF